MLRRATLAALCGALWSCASLNQPMNPGEYRDAFKKNSWPMETFETARSYQQVAAILHKKAKECLDVTVERTTRESQGNMIVAQRSRIVYKPTVTVTKERAELAVQRGAPGGSSHPMYKVPPDGYYIFLADAAPSGRNATSVTVYPAGGGGSEIASAVRGWVRGDNMACPDLVKVP